MSVSRADARFLLPAPARHASVWGSPEGWRDALARAGISVESPRGGQPDLAVASSAHAAKAVASGADMLVIEGRAGRALSAAGYPVRRCFALPTVDRPEILVPVGSPAAARYAFSRLAVPGRRWKGTRNRLAATLIGRGVAPASRLVTIGLRRPGPPFLLTAAARLGVRTDGSWLLTTGAGDELTRGVFHVFAPHTQTPAWAVKFARVPGYADAFDRDERGLALARSAGGAVSAHAPQLLGRFQVDGLHASVETAAVGARLIALLHAAGPRARKLRIIEAIAAWIVEVGRETAAHERALEEERARLAAAVVPRFVELGVSPSLVTSLPALPAVLQHNDLGSWNIVVDGATFTALDWEGARLHGLPLWDVLYFLADALAHLDGATTLEDQARHFIRLFGGELSSSAVLFHWTREAATAARVPPEAVGPIATLGWLHHGLSHVARREAVERHAAGAPVPVLSERLPRLWLSHPALGTTWDRWQR